MTSTKIPGFRKLLSPTLITGLLASALVMLPVAPASAQSATCTFASGAGTELSPYQVATAADLAMVRDCHGSANNLFFEQTANIDLGAEANWVPIGTVAQPFDDSYDGKFFEIDGLTINATAAANLTHFGLFGKITTTSGEPTVKSIHLTDVDVDVVADGQKVFVGGVIGESDRTTLNGRFRVQGDITVTGTAAADSAAGGIYGRYVLGLGHFADFATSFEGVITSSADFTGGIVGDLLEVVANGVSIESASIRGSVTGAKHTGRFAGRVDNQEQNLDMYNFYFAATANSEDAGLPDGRVIGTRIGVGGFRLFQYIEVSDLSGTFELLPITVANRLGLVTSTSEIALPNSYISCVELNSGKPVQRAFFLDKFPDLNRGPCDLPKTGLAPVSVSATSFEFDLSAPVGFYGIDNSKLTLASDPSELFTLSPSVSNGMGTLVSSQTLPIGSYPITITLERPDLALYGAASITIKIVSCVDSGSGTKADPYTLSTAAQLALLADCSAGPETHFKLTTDLDLGADLASNWDPIGSDSVQFTGVFDGGGHTISGLRIDGTLHSKPLGLFSTTYKAKIHNLVLTDAKVTQDQADRRPSGVLVGEADVLEGEDDRGLEVFNVQISDSEIVGSLDLGILLGDARTEAVSISKVEITGSKIRTPEGSTLNAENIGLLGARFYEHSTISDTHVSDSSIELSTTDYVASVAGFMVGCNQEMLVRDSSVSEVRIVIDAVGKVENVAGFIAGTGFLGESCVFIDSSAETNIAIASGGYAENIAGFANDVEEAVFLRVRSTSIIDIVADGSVTEVGGFIGEIDNSEHAAISKVESFSTITIVSKDPNISITSPVREIGLFIGAGASFAISDVLVEGSIEIQVAEGRPIVTTSNFLGSINSSNDSRQRFLSNVLINAVPIVATDLAATPNVVALSGISYVFGNSATSVFVASRGVFWNSTSDPGYASDAYATAASAADISSQAFLTAGGFNFNRDWCMIDGKPRVEAVNPGCLSPASAGSTSFGGGAGSASFQGPVVTSAPAQAIAGQTITLVGERLDSVTAARINGIQAQLRVNNDGSLTVTIPEALTIGTFDIELVSSLGSVTIKAAVTISAAVPALASRTGWTKSQSDGTVKVYAKAVVGLGKIQFRQNGKEIAWIRAVDETDPKLRKVTSGPMAGTNYLVRTVTLLPGKNALEIFVDGERVWRAAYTLR